MADGTQNVEISIRLQRMGKTQSRSLILGLDGAGKTTILTRLRGITGVHSNPTEIYETHNVKRRGLKTEFWDVSGHRSKRTLWPYYYQGTRTPQVIIWVVDASDASRLPEGKRELHRVCKDKALQDAIILVLLNKCDLPHARSACFIAAGLDLQSIKQTLYCKKLSATTGFNYKQTKKCLYKILRQLRGVKDFDEYYD
mmetsp:Transcript_25386/g.28237  ORF Transcript_25386/g.28237 Transcript_25386/m.28237 type:complete len:198 (-) Transcript_25386:25-618(-)